MIRIRFAFVGLVLVAWVAARIDLAAAGQRLRVQVTSSIDGHQQPCYITLPDGYQQDRGPVPLLVSVHSWSTDLERRRPEQERLAAARGWICLFPNFRGPNNHPDACGSLKAQQDILDAVAWTQQQYDIDARRIYLVGVSGGGHMTMLMAGRHPQVWAAASAWVGISDLAKWHAKHKDSKYGRMMRNSCGGAPGTSTDVDAQYRARSPLTHLHRARDVPLDIAAGIHDGHTGSVPVWHSLAAFNQIARAAGDREISADEMRQLSQPDGRLENPKPSDREQDTVLGRSIYLRRRAGKARVTIFEGGHECIVAAAFAWFDQHPRP